jgi:hypothetical protein
MVGGCIKPFSKTAQQKRNITIRNHMESATKMPVSIRYRFTQKFAVSAKAAFDWCTSFDPGDHALMGDKAERQVTQIANGSILLKDTFHTATGTVEKQKLVQLYPEQLRWTSTHISGPNVYSQFLYVITQKGKNSSVLEFIALHIERNDKIDAEQLSKSLCKEDAGVWVLLAAAMEKELKPKSIKKK